MFLQIDYTSLFYWLVVADNAKDFFLTGVVIFMIVSTIATIGYFCNTDDDEDANKYQTMSRKWIWWSYPFCILFWSLYVFTPSKKDALIIVAGGQTLNFLANDKSAKQIPSELSNFVLTEVKNLAKEAEVDLNISSQKDKMLEKAKSMTTEQLLEEMKKDSIFAKIILKEN